MKHVIKDNGKVETFNSKKLSKSLERTLMSNHYSASRAKDISHSVTQQVVEWLASKTEVTITDIRAQSSKRLARIDKNVALLYKKHKELW